MSGDAGAPAADEPFVVRYFTRAGCHLCERGRDEVEYARESEGGFVVEEHDIDADPALRARYRLTIPVVEANGRELAWPFRASEVRALVRSARAPGAAGAGPSGE